MTLWHGMNDDDFLAFDEPIQLQVVSFPLGQASNTVNVNAYPFPGPARHTHTELGRIVDVQFELTFIGMMAEEIEPGRLPAERHVDADHVITFLDGSVPGMEQRPRPGPPAAAGDMPPPCDKKIVRRRIPGEAADRPSSDVLIRRAKCVRWDGLRLLFRQALELAFHQMIPGESFHVLPVVVVDGIRSISKKIYLDFFFCYFTTSD